MRTKIPESILTRTLAFSMTEPTPDYSPHGSSFLYFEDDQSWIITASHNFQHPKDQSCSEALHKGAISFYILKKSWTKLTGKVYHYDSAFPNGPKVDISVIKLDKNLSTLPHIELSSDNLFLAQDAFFLGFPFAAEEITYKPYPELGDHPVPLIKKGIISQIGPQKILFDGHNNPGHSGGPLIYYSDEKECYLVAGIIHALISNDVHLKMFIPEHPEDKLKAQYDERFFTEVHSGINEAYDIKYAVEIIKKYKGQ